MCLWNYFLYEWSYNCSIKVLSRLQSSQFPPSKLSFSSCEAPAKESDPQGVWDVKRNNSRERKTYTSRLSPCLSLLFQPCFLLFRLTTHAFLNPMQKYGLFCPGKHCKRHRKKLSTITIICMAQSSNLGQVFYHYDGSHSGHSTLLKGE